MQPTVQHLNRYLALAQTPDAWREKGDGQSGDDDQDNDRKIGI